MKNNNEIAQKSILLFLPHKDYYSIGHEPNGHSQKHTKNVWYNTKQNFIYF